MTRKQRLALGCYVSRWYPSGMKLGSLLDHALRALDREADIPKCRGFQHGDSCGKPAEFCEHMYWSSGPGIAIFYYCAACWTKPNFTGKSAQDRARVVPEHLNRTPIQNDESDRANCPKAGEVGHRCCGICPEHAKPRFECGCVSGFRRRFRLLNKKEVPTV